MVLRGKHAPKSGSLPGAGDRREREVPCIFASGQVPFPARTRKHRMHRTRPAPISLSGAIRLRGGSPDLGKKRVGLHFSYDDRISPCEGHRQACRTRGQCLQARASVSFRVYRSACNPSVSFASGGRPTCKRRRVQPGCASTTDAVGMRQSGRNPAFFSEMVAFGGAADRQRASYETPDAVCIAGDGVGNV